MTSHRVAPRPVPPPRRRAGVGLVALVLGALVAFLAAPLASGAASVGAASVGAASVGAARVGDGSSTPDARAQDDNDSGPVQVTLSPIGGSGISGSATYGSQVTATASGMDPDKSYISYVYGAGSDDTGDNPCILTGETLAGPGNTVGRWEVSSDGTGTLSADAPVSVERAGTLSIRENDLGLDGVTGPTPLDTLVACGRVGPDRDTPLGSVQDALPPLPAVKVEDPVGTATGALSRDSLASLTDRGVVDADGVGSDDTDDDGETDAEELATEKLRSSGAGASNTEDTEDAEDD